MQTPPTARKSLIDFHVCSRLGDTHVKTNARPYVLYRQIAMHLMRQAGYSLSEIGRYFKAHHTTVLSSAQKVQLLRQQSAEWEEAIRLIEADIAAGNAGGSKILLPKEVRRESVLRLIIREELASVRKAGAA